MLTITIKLNTDDAAFEDDPALELRRALNHVAHVLETGQADLIIGSTPRRATRLIEPHHDTNGNAIGTITVRLTGKCRP